MESRPGNDQPDENGTMVPRHQNIKNTSMYKFFIRTYGCQMNDRDSEAASAILASAGFSAAKDIEDAQITILNTCSVRDSAERKVKGFLWQLKGWKEKNEKRIIGLIGCMAESYKDALLEEFSHLDFVLGPGQMGLLPQTISEIIYSKNKKRITETEAEKPYDDIKTHLPAGKVSAYIPIMRGCNMFCSYCIVPYVRGRERSRPLNEIIEEAKLLAEKGVKEIFLLGQNVAAYGFDKEKNSKKSSLAGLLSKIAEIPEIQRIRFTSPHPADFNDELIRAVCEIRKVCGHVHIPLQSGSDKILGLMNRHYTAAEYVNITEKLRRGCPEIVFSTDVIVGFPGETDSDFQDTRTLLNDVGFDQIFIFKYSKRKNTPAADMDNQVDTKIKEERNQILLADLKSRAKKTNKSFLGKTVEVMVESSSSKRNDRLIGKTSSNKTVVLWKKKDIVPGDIVKVLVEDSTLAALYGTPL
jgi:tRNA-2-methylthio-N6-dimethylallyladenosine synthase